MFVYPAEIARSIHDGSVGDRSYNCVDWLPESLATEFLNLGWVHVTWTEPFSRYAVKLRSPEQDREVVICSYDNPGMDLQDVDVEIFRVKPPASLAAVG